MMDIIVGVLGYTTARLVLPIITLGKVRVQPISSSERGFNWLGFKRARDGSLMCHMDLAGMIGVCLWLFTAVVVATA
ncbi:hypothetical protein JVX98_10935 [Ensifer sp. PDNC004]|uniref:hypothetical protein n=1 Tax=Ensifer sp. PDNC004 TaxID=2811423 RepID=UPI0019651AF5|nr:hypothetical protein [Ensifer sp. PDNC004]QRY68756.1 hypothetical protein JVX98_10935 [Ensifer sp. PDNC004]